MSDNLAIMYSWLGGKGKKILANSPLVEVIYGAVRANEATKAVTDTMMIEEIKNWLRHAPQRVKSKLLSRETESTESQVELPVQQNGEPQ